jgi:hypothetical protein
MRGDNDLLGGSDACCCTAGKADMPLLVEPVGMSDTGCTLGTVKLTSKDTVMLGPPDTVTVAV